MTKNRYLMYLSALQKPFKKLSRLEFLQPDGSVAFSISNNFKRGYSGAHDTRAFLQDGSLNVSMQNGMRRKANIVLANIDGAFEYSFNKIWFGRQVRLSMGLVLPDGTDFYLPQGVFYLKEPRGETAPSKKQVSYTLVDKWAYLDGSLFGTLPYSYSIPIGTNVFLGMQKVLQLSKANLKDATTDKLMMLDYVTPAFTNYYNNLPPIQYKVGSETKTANANETAFLTTVQMGGSCGDIILELNKNIIGLIGYDPTGRFFVEPSQENLLDSDKAVLWNFTTSNCNLLSYSESAKDSEVFNDVIVVGEGLTSGAVYGRATNYDPKSDTNANILGIKTKVESRAEYWNANQCVDMAKYMLKKKTILQNSITIQSTQIFHLMENRLVSIQRADKQGVPTEKHLIQSFSLPIGETGSMTINATSVNELPNLSTVSSTEIGGQQNA